MSGPKWLCAVLVATVTATGALTPVAARAQSPLQSMQSDEPESAESGPGTGAKVGAGILNVVYVPGRAIICSASLVVAGGFMLLTFGTAYREAVSFFNEGCRGSWALTAEQVAAVQKRAGFEH